MKSFPRIQTTAAASLLAIPLLLSGCGIFGSQGAAQIDPPPANVEAQMLQTTDQVNQTSSSGKTSSENTNQATVYLKNDQGLLAPVSLNLPQGSKEGKLNQLMESLVQEGTYASSIPEGFQGVLPKGTQVTNVSVDKRQKLAVVEFTKPFTNYDVKDERKIMEAITWTLTDNPDVQNVQLWVDGQKLNEMPVGHIPLNQPLNRTVGINLELTPGANVSQTSPVTVYFSSSTKSGVPYFVPVTRLVPAGEDSVKAALAQLIEGPVQGDGLQQVLTSNTSVEQVETAKDGIVTVSLKDDMFKPGEKVPAQLLQSLVLTVTENTKSGKVRIWMNGSKNVVGDDNQKYSEPVSRPEALNHIPI